MGSCYHGVGRANHCCRADAKHKATSVCLFGSVARGDATAVSDVDVLIEIDCNTTFSLVEQAGVEIDLEKAIGWPVDVVLRKSLRPELQQSALADIVQVF